MTEQEKINKETALALAKLPAGAQLALYQNALATDNDGMAKMLELIDPKLKYAQLPERQRKMQGQLIRHRHVDYDTNQVYYTFTGDKRTWRDAFTAPPVRFDLNVELCKDFHETKVGTRDGERIAVLAADGKVLRTITPCSP